MFLKINKVQQQQINIYLILLIIFYYLISIFHATKIIKNDYNSSIVLNNENNQCKYPINIGLLLPEQYRQKINPWLTLALKHLHQILEGYYYYFLIPKGSINIKIGNFFFFKKFFFFICLSK
jgi:hypothetical protein